MDKYVLFKKGKQKRILEKAISTFGSERKLAKVWKIPYQTINFYRNEKYNLPEKRLRSLLKLLKADYNILSKDIVSYLDKNWGRKKGGNKLMEYKRLNGAYDQYLKYLQKRGRKIFRDWHKAMRKEDEDEYLKIQFERFKKSLKSSSNRNFVTKRGERVRNILEKEVADFLNSLNLNYEYEPFIKIDNKAYFPDFKIGNLIIECTMWKGTMKVDSLRRKVKDYEKKGFNVRLIIPKDIAKFYKPFKNKIFTDINEASVAQSILELSEMGEMVRATRL